MYEKGKEGGKEGKKVEKKGLREEKGRGGKKPM